MNRAGLKKHIGTPVFNAWLDDVYRSDNYQFLWVEEAAKGIWRDCVGDPTWDEEYKYRVKPQPITVERWVNIYGGEPSWLLHESEKDAKAYSPYNATEPVPITITYTPGEQEDEL